MRSGKEVFDNSGMSTGHTFVTRLTLQSDHCHRLDRAFGL